MTGALQQVYARVPVWVQNAMCSVEGLRIRAQRFPLGFDARVHKVETRMQWTAQQREAFRIGKLRAMLVHAGKHVPYWRDLFADHRFRPERLQHVSELEALPVLTKSTVVEEGDRMRAETLPAGNEAGRAFRFKTSGTTGAGLVFDLSEGALRHQWAVCWRYRRWYGLQRGQWCAQLTGRTVVPVEHREPPYYRINYAGRQLLFSGYHLSPSTTGVYLEQIEQRGVGWVHGYPSLVVLLAEAAVARGRPVESVRWVSLASESVTAAQRATIEAGFGVAPFEHYAQTEAVANASQRPDGSFRLDDDFSVVELLRDDGLGDGSLRRLVGTSLDNWHMPFIRYDSGDIARVDEAALEDDLAPGRPLLAIDGRREEYVVLRDGSMVGRTDHIFKELTFIREAQIRQREPGAIAIHVVPRGVWQDVHEQRLRSETLERLGRDMELVIVLEESLPRTAAGKLRQVVREGDLEPESVG